MPLPENSTSMTMEALKMLSNSCYSDIVLALFTHIILWSSYGVPVKFYFHFTTFCTVSNSSESAHQHNLYHFCLLKRLKNYTVKPLKMDIP